MVYDCILFSKTLHYTPTHSHPSNTCPMQTGEPWSYEHISIPARCGQHYHISQSCINMRRPVTISSCVILGHIRIKIDNWWLVRSCLCDDGPHKTRIKVWQGEDSTCYHTTLKPGVIESMQENEERSFFQKFYQWPNGKSPDNFYMNTIMLNILWTKN